MNAPTPELTLETAVSRAKEIAGDLLAPAAADNDKAGRFSTEAIEALGQAGLHPARRPRPRARRD